MTTLPRVVAILLVGFTVSMSGSFALANPIGFTFTTLPASGSIAAPAGTTIGWGYTITNTSATDWLLTTALSAVFPIGSPALLFDFPILAPGTTVTVAYDPTFFVGLYELTWDPNEPVGSVSSGVFVLSAEWWSGDPFDGGAFLDFAADQTADFSATVSGSASVPEPATYMLLLAGIATLCLTRIRRCLVRWRSVALFPAVAVLFTSTAGAQSPNPNHMCGDGTTFTVHLNGAVMLPDGSAAPDDSVAIPNACRIYAFLVSGYSRNKDLDELTFYNLAKFVAENNGYVHYSWWNNLLEPYMGGPLHDKTVTIPGLLGTHTATPGGLGGVHAIGFGPSLGFGNNVNTLVPKAIPEEDTQFLADAKEVFKEIRQRHPNAIILVAGHSMGGAAVAKLGADSSVSIDLLAPIDPVGNRTFPVGMTGTSSYNWTRWRATHTFKGYRQADCIRNSNNFCKDFDDRLLFKEFRCEPTGVGAWLDKPPLIPTLAPGKCSGPIVDSGTRITIRTNVKHMVHRWQHENLFPFDFLKDEKFNYLGKDTASVPGPIVLAQKGLDKNGILESNPTKTCAPPVGGKKQDPLDDTLDCDPQDGHGEIVGFRGMAASGAIPIGLTAQNWPTTRSGRRDKLIEMVTAPAPDFFKKSTGPHNWEHEPLNPHLDMVGDDILKVLQKIMAGQPVTLDNEAPTTVASLDPAALSSGWHNTDVDLLLSAAEEPGGSGVKEIYHTFSGARVGSGLTPADTSHHTITEEGVTTVDFFARDNAGNAETAQTLDIKIDKTPPSIVAVAQSPNAAGWRNADTLVSFSVSDAGSGVLSAPAEVVVSSEGADQEIVGIAQDNAENQAAAAVLVSLDKTAATVGITAPQDGAVYPMQSALNSAYTCADTLSGIQACAGPAADGTPFDTSTAGQKQFVVNATDAAGNVSNKTHSYSVIVGQPRVAGTVIEKGRDQVGNYSVLIEFKNTGTGHARSVRLSSLVLRTLSGTGTVTLMSPSVPLDIGDLNVGEVQSQRFYLNVPSTVLRFSITESGTLRDVTNTSLNYSIGQAVIP